MPVEFSLLGQAFVEDHQQLTKGLSRLLEALKLNNLKEAVDAAETLNRVAGPHIQFEEEIMYPKVAKARGEEFIRQLYEEHRIGLNAVKELLARETNTPLNNDEQTRLIREVEIALDHAISCGTLLSYVTTLDESVQSDLLDRLNEYRKTGCCWTEVSSHNVLQQSTQKGKKDHVE